MDTSGSTLVGAGLSVGGPRPKSHFSRNSCVCLLIVRLGSFSFSHSLCSNKLVVGGWIVCACRLLSCYIVGKVPDAAACSCKQVQPRPFQTGNCISDITDDYKRFWWLEQMGRWIMSSWSVTAFVWKEVVNQSQNCSVSMLDKLMLNVKLNRIDLMIYNTDAIVNK